MFVGTAAGMFGYELTKTLLLPAMSLWESHAVTIVFGAVVATVGARWALRRQERLHRQVVEHVAARERLEARGVALIEHASRYRRLVELSLEATFLHRDGRVLYANHACARTLGATDATARRDAEPVLRASEQRLRLALDAVRMVVWERDLVSQAVTLHTASPAPAPVPTTTADSAAAAAVRADAARGFLDSVHPEDRDRVRDASARARDTAGAFDVAYRVLGEDGEVRWRHTSGRGFPDVGGRPARMIGVDHDVTESKRQEEAIRERETRLQLILQQRPAVLWTTDPELRVLSCVGTGLARTGLAAGRLTLEVTETAVMRDTEHAQATLHALKALGVHIAVDDFGTGSSSLSYLQQFPVDVLKIDKAFVDGVARGGADAALARTIIALGHTCGLRTVAEGVEREWSTRASGPRSPRSGAPWRRATCSRARWRRRPPSRPRAYPRATVDRRRRFVRPAARRPRRQLRRASLCS